MLRKNFLKEKLDAGKTVLGTWSVIPSPAVADILASSGLDFVIIDREHGPTGFETAQMMAMACESRGVSPLIRVGGVDRAEILRALETGAHGLHIPNVHRAEDLRKAASFSAYPPKGTRGFSPFTRASGYSHLNSAAAHSIEGSALLAVHIEGPLAEKNLEPMLKTEGVDIYFVGLFDLSASLGIPGELHHPRLQKAFKKIVQKIRKAGKIPGSIVTSRDQLKTAEAQGVRYITYSADCDMLLRSYRAIRSPR